MSRRLLPLLLVLGCGSRSAPPPSTDPAPSPLPSDASVPVPTSEPPNLGTSELPAPPIAGFVVDDGNAPLAGVHVTIHDPSGATADVADDSAADGSFRAALPASGERTILLDGASVFPAEARWHGGAIQPRIVLTRRLEIDARVTANSAPVAGADVHLGDGASEVVATTGADGIARFTDQAPGPYEIWAVRGELVTPLVRTIAVAGAKPLALALAAGTAVKGQVIADAPLPAGAAVRLAPDDVDHATRVAAVDPQGRFTLDGVPRGHWHVTTDIDGFFLATSTDVAIAGASTKVTVDVVRAGAVTGVVVDQTGAPVRGAQLVLRGQGDGAPASQEEAALPSHLRWVHPLAGPRQMPGRDIRRFGAPRAGIRQAECGRGHCGVDIGHTRGAIIHAAADGILVTVHREIHKEAGRFVVIEHAGGLRTHYLHMDVIRGDLEEGMHVRAGEPLGRVGQTGDAAAPHLHFAMSEVHQGRDFYVDPEPMLEHAVVLADEGSLDVPMGPTGALYASIREDAAAPALPAARFVTDDTGAFRLDGVAPGDYVAVAFHPALAPAASAPFHLAPGGSADGVRIVLTPGVVVTGQVMAANGPVAGARVAAGEGFGETEHQVAVTFTDAAGAYTLRALSGEVTLTVTATGYGDGERELVLDDAKVDTDREDFDLANEDARLMGTVRGPDGGAVPGASVRVVDGPSQHRSGATDPTGRFLIANVAAGTYTIEVSSPDFPPTRATLDTGDDHPITLEQGGSLAVSVRDAHTGESLPGIGVTASAPGQRARTVTSDAAGLASLPALPVGHWTLRARVPGYTSASADLDVPASRTPLDVTLALSRGAILAGIVRDHYGRRVAGATVSVGDATCTTDGDGNFRLADVPTGDVTLTATLGDARTDLPLELAPGDEQVTLTVDLPGD